MQNRGLSTLLDYLRRELPLPGADTVSDGDLLTRFIASKDEAAFELLVRRHGPMVFGVARRMARDEHAAEDVLQATFLALARQAKSLRKNPNVAGWLYRVAVRISRRARGLKTPPVRASVTNENPAAELLQQELRSELDAAIDRLPDKLRQSVLHCYIMGQTIEEAARLLECPKGTVLLRLAAARVKLQADLTRRGIVVSTATLTTALSTEMSTASLPAALVELALKAIGPSAALTPIVVSLAQGVVAMTWMKLTVASVASLTITLGLATVFAGPSTKQPNAPESVSIPEPAAEQPDRQDEDEPALPKELIAFRDAVKLSWDQKDPELTRTMRQRVMTAYRELELRTRECFVGRGELGALIDCAQRALQARLEAGVTQAEELKIRETFQDFAAGLANLQKERFQVGVIKQQDLERVMYLYYTAQIDLLKFKQRIETGR
jgi:RNA polymerase sigma factor (sigma-70 family)